MKRSIRVRLVVSVLAVLLPLILGGGWLLNRLFDQRVARDVDVALREEAETVAEVVSASAEPKTLEELLAHIVVENGDGASKHVVVRRDDLVIAEAPSGSANAEHAGASPLHSVEYRSPDGRIDVRIAVHLSPTPPPTQHLRSLLVVGIPLLSILTALALWLVVGRALQPLEAAAQGLERLGAADLSARLPIDNAQDEVGRLVGTLNRLLERLDTAMTELRRFSGDAAHALRTPLTVLRTGLDVALAQPRTADEYRAALTEAVASAERMSGVTDRLLTLARLDAADTAHSATTVDIGEILRELGDAFAPHAGQTGLVIETKTAPDLLVRGVSADLYRLFYDLIDNAVRYAGTPLDASRAVIQLTASRVGDAVEATIADSGAGINAADLPHLFDRFYRGHERRSDDGGTGLGLSIAEQIVRTHGGSIRVENRNGGGCIVTVTLPVGP